MRVLIGQRAIVNCTGKLGENKVDFIKASAHFLLVYFCNKRLGILGELLKNLQIICFKLMIKNCSQHLAVIIMPVIQPIERGLEGSKQILLCCLDTYPFKSLFQVSIFADLAQM